MNQILKTFFLISLVGFISCTTYVDKNKASIENNLSDPNASCKAIHLYNTMLKLAPNYTMVGHQDALAYGIGWKAEAFRSDINDVCGDHPAIFGWDLGHIADSSNIDDVSFQNMKKWALEAYEKGGINTYGWHSKHFVTGGSSWDTDSCVANILPGGNKHDNFIAKLDLVADFFAALKGKDGDLIPVLFRPFHEMNGGWFWWGAKSCTPDEYKSLWKFTVEYLRNERQLHNIIYIYSTDVFESADDYLTYYPGDDYVDILGYDDYKGLNNPSSTHESVKMLEILAELGKQKQKLYTISETGLETIPDSTWFTNVVLKTINTNPKTKGISYILFWRNGRPDHFYAPYPGHSSSASFNEFKKDTSIFFLQDISNRNLYENGQ